MTVVGNADLVRPMRWQDVEAVVALEQLSYPQTAWSVATWWAELACRPRRAYLVHLDAAFDGEIAGYAGVDIGGADADVMTITVDPAHRGAGVGSRLLQGVHDQAMAAGAQRILLEVRADNDSARRLYARNGYAAIARREGYYQPDGVDAIVLRAHLDRGTSQTAGTAQ